jgi:hypothetical protein
MSCERVGGEAGGETRHDDDDGSKGAVLAMRRGPYISAVVGRGRQ